MMKHEELKVLGQPCRENFSLQIHEIYCKPVDADGAAPLSPPEQPQGVCVGSTFFGFGVCGAAAAAGAAGAERRATAGGGAAEQDPNKNSTMLIITQEEN